jgi:uncharacterized membrane protein
VKVNDKVKRALIVHDLDLLLTNISILTLLFTVLFFPDVVLVRLLLAIPFSLFFPGYVLISALFPRKSDLQMSERVILSLVLGIAIVSLLGISFNYSPWGIELYTLLIPQIILIFSLSILAWWRRRQVSPDERFMVAMRIPAIWSKPHGLDLVLLIALVVSGSFGVGSLGYSLLFPISREHFTEFYTLSPYGFAVPLPTEAVEGYETSRVVGVVNWEGCPMTYRVEVQLNGELVNSSAPFTLQNGVRKESLITFAPSVAGKKQKLEFLLFTANNNSAPYLYTYQWIDVKARSADNSSTLFYITKYPGLDPIPLNITIILEVSVENYEFRTMNYSILTWNSWTGSINVDGRLEFVPLGNVVLEDGEKTVVKIPIANYPKGHHRLVLLLVETATGYEKGLIFFDFNSS